MFGGKFLSNTCLGLSQQGTLSIINTHKPHRMFKYAHTSSHYSLLAQEPVWAACPGSLLEMQGLGPCPTPAGLDSMEVTMVFGDEMHWTNVLMQFRILVLFTFCPTTIILGWQYLSSYKCLLCCSVGTHCPLPFHTAKLRRAKSLGEHK